ncbi:TIGR02234 family membrane protein [Rhodococcus sp. D2-41]|uniref:TIGR02234 family membrane protein n=1 Tax=Speluncibacter jeojiensis TaxID=2710754 RepID=A0A9X4LZV4_9ACTN|nr:TIGR02234 family membrane protein [Rhodococcus sp. D2-41]MDG3012077.1 TIGR02234 family membrane protein [Rhodococcus sp. D2-41]MDG3013602.1 TIGR02234 family membrane protein [Corynebacteriales bacterium D3-21]
MTEQSQSPASEPAEPTATDAATAAAKAQRRRKGLVAVALVAAALCLWIASRATWVRYTSFDQLQPPKDGTISGASWAGELTPLALVLLAAIAASFAVRGWALRVVGVIVALVAVVAGVRAVRTLTESGAVSADRISQIAELPARAAVTHSDVVAWPPVVALVGAVLALIAAVGLVRKPRSVGAAGLSSKYQTPAARRAEATRRADKARSDKARGGEQVDEDLTERMLWDALDAGEDPTVDQGDDGSGGTGRDSDTR